MRILVTGSPGAGKTTLINTMKEQIHIVADYSRVLLGEFKLDLDKEHLKIQELWFINMLETYKNYSDAIFEYGFPDIISYLKFREVDHALINKKFTQTANELRYDSVIFIEPLIEDYYVNDNVRTMKYFDTIRVSKIMINVLLDLHYNDIIFIQYLPLKQRIEVFKNCIMKLINK